MEINKKLAGDEVFLLIEDSDLNLVMNEPCGNVKWISEYQIYNHLISLEAGNIPCEIKSAVV